MDLIFDPNLVLYLPLYELDGNSFVSKDKHGHLCTVNGALWQRRGRFFDGVDDVAVLPDSPHLQISSAITVESVFTPDRIPFSGNERVIEKAGVDYSILGISNQDEVQAGLTIAGSQRNLNSVNANLVQGVTCHIAFTFDGTIWCLYINGQANTSTCSYTGAIAVSNLPLYIGRAAGSWGWLKGVIRSLTIYNRALSFPEIQHNYLATKRRYR